MWMPVAWQAVPPLFVILQVPSLKPRDDWAGELVQWQRHWLSSLTTMFDPWSAHRERRQMTSDLHTPPTHKNTVSK